MPLSPGDHLDSYDILELLGAGGMGEVYRGRDTVLGRNVAVKALPEVFARDVERLARFQREAQALATLNHPNIAVIHELKEVNGAKYLILEMVEGETLGDVIARGPIPIDEAIPIARQIAEAVEAAHDQGIVHRDLKPSNIKITPEGRVKVLDFGLAKIQEFPNPSRTGSQSIPLSKMNTAAGVVLGTAPYMSPEQARGKTVDRRADVWAFGCVLYEMITGRQAFPKGETVSDTLAGILAKEPDWQALPAETPPRIRVLLERCLRKDVQKRLQDMGNARIELEEAHSESEAVASGAMPKAPTRRREMWLAIVAGISGLLFASLAFSFFFAPVVKRPAVRYEAVPPNNLANDGGYVLSPDGLKVAFVTTQPAQLWVRPLDRALADPIPSTEGITGANVFWSPDNQHIGFFAEGKLKTVAAGGGPAQVIVNNLPAGGNYSGTWNKDDVILIGSDANPGGPLLRVPAGGGDLKPATELDKASKEISHRYPYFMPDGRHFVYLTVGSDGRDRAVYWGDLKSKERHRLEGIAAETKYSSSGHLVFIRDGALMAQPFDPNRGELTGASFAITDNFAPAAALSYPFSVSMTGALSFRTNPSGGIGGGVGITTLMWFDSKGTRLQAAGIDGEYRGPELSPDGKYVAFARGAPADIWVLEIESGRTERLTSDPADDLNPRWSRDSKKIVFDSAREGVANLYESAVGVGAEAKLVLKSEAAKTMGDWSLDGKYLVYISDNDIWALPMPEKPSAGKSGGADSDPKPSRITNTPHIEKMPRVSPDGHWIAYVSNEPGEDRVYVQSFPTPGVRLPVSTGGGLDPRWSRTGDEIFYYWGQTYPYTTASGAVYGVSVRPAGPSLDLGMPLTVANRGIPGTTAFSVAADGRLLLQMNPGLGTRGFSLAGRPVGTNRETTVLTIIFDWIGIRAASNSG